MPQAHRKLSHKEDHYCQVDPHKHNFLITSRTGVSTFCSVQEASTLVFGITAAAALCGPSDFCTVHIVAIRDWLVFFL